MSNAARTADIKRTLGPIAAKVTTKVDRYGDTISKIWVKDTDNIEQAKTRLKAAGYNVEQIGDSLTV